MFALGRAEGRHDQVCLFSPESLLRDARQRLRLLDVLGRRGHLTGQNETMDILAYNWAADDCCSERRCSPGFAGPPSLAPDFKRSSSDVG